MVWRRSWKNEAILSDDRARVLSAQLEEEKQKRKAAEKELHREQARASHAVRMLKDGTEAGDLRAELAEARAALVSFKQEAALAALDGSAGAAAVPARVEGHDAKYWHEQAVDLREELEQIKAGSVKRVLLEAERRKSQALLEELEALRAKSGSKHAGGRPKVYGPDMVEKVKAMRGEGVPIRTIGRRLGMAASTVQRLLKE